MTGIGVVDFSRLSHADNGSTSIIDNGTHCGRKHQMSVEWCDSEMELPQDEYRWLAGHYDKLLEQREEVYEQVAAIRPLLQKKFLLSLLDGESSPDEIMHQVSVLELPFQMSMFGTFLLQIDDYYSLPYSEEEKQEFRAQIQAQITAYANEQVSCITAEVNDETILCVCNLQAEEKEETAKQIFRSYLQEIRDGIGELWPFTLTIGIGGVCCSPTELPASCQKARPDQPSRRTQRLRVCREKGLRTEKAAV